MDGTDSRKSECSPGAVSMRDQERGGNPGTASARLLERAMEVGSRLAGRVRSLQEALRKRIDLDIEVFEDIARAAENGDTDEVLRIVDAVRRVNFDANVRCILDSLHWTEDKD